MYDDLYAGSAGLFLLIVLIGAVGWVWRQYSADRAGRSYEKRRERFRISPERERILQQVRDAKTTPEIRKANEAFHEYRKRSRDPYVWDAWIEAEKERDAERVPEQRSGGRLRTSGEPTPKLHYHVYEHASGERLRRIVGIFPDREAAETYAAEYVAGVVRDAADQGGTIVIGGDARSGFSYTGELSDSVPFATGRLAGPPQKVDLGGLRVESCEQVGCRKGPVS